MVFTAAHQVISNDDVEMSRSSTEAARAMESSGHLDADLPPMVAWRKASIGFVLCVLVFCVALHGGVVGNGGALNAHESVLARHLQTIQVVDMGDLPIFPGLMCNGPPLSGWGGLGTNLHSDVCRQECLADAACKFAVYRPENGACSSFASCAERKTSSGFLVWPKLTTHIDFDALLASVVESCTSTAEKPEFKVLGCRGTDSRCAAYGAPDAVNENSCKYLHRAGADCAWALEDPTGYCAGHDSRCGEDHYKTEWGCEQLRKSGASCTWRERPEHSSPVVDAAKLKERVDALIAQLNLYVPALQVNSTALMGLFGTAPETICVHRADRIGLAIAAYASATAQIQLALNPKTPVEHLQDLASEAKGASGFSAAFTSFRDTYAPKVFGCTGHHSECKDQTTESACKTAGGDCAWATTQQSGSCEGNDSRCSMIPYRRWKEGCDALKAQHASCTWVLAESYKRDSAGLVEELKGVVAISPSDLQGVLSTDFEERLAAIECSAAAVQMSFMNLTLAAGMS